MSGFGHVAVCTRVRHSFLDLGAKRWPDMPPAPDATGVPSTIHNRAVPLCVLAFSPYSILCFIHCCRASPEGFFLGSGYQLCGSAVPHLFSQGCCSWSAVQTTSPATALTTKPPSENKREIFRRRTRGGNKNDRPGRHAYRFMV